MIWAVKPNLEAINEFQRNTLVEHLDIKLSDVGDDFLEATMPVDSRTKQPMGLLHGGASAALAETVGSIASFLVVGDTATSVVGLELNSNHLNSVRSGLVTARATPIKIGRTIHVWEINIKDDNGTLACRSRLTMMVKR